MSETNNPYENEEDLPEELRQIIQTDRLSTESVPSISKCKNFSPALESFDYSREPVFLYDENCALLNANPAARVLLETLPISKEIESAVREHNTQNTLSRHRVNVTFSGVSLCYELYMMPASLDSKAVCLMLARDVTMDQNLRDALIESRSRYKDFVDISSDFAWETDTEGRFTFVSPKGALGFTAHDLINKKANAMLLKLPSMSVNSPFETRRTVESVELWMNTASGKPACLRTAALPVLDSNRKWIGSRGVCRDITHYRELDIIANQAREREKLLGHIIRTFRDEVDPEEMLAAAAQAICSGLQVESCEIYRQSALSPDAEPGSEMFPIIDSSGNLPPENIRKEMYSAAVNRQATRMQFDKWFALAHITQYNREQNGILCVWRKATQIQDETPQDQNDNSWDTDERVLVADISAQIGVAIAQVVQHEHILTLSRTDPLTQLYNRRAFFEEAKRRYSRQRMSHSMSALFYVDLDNFKQVNDTHGHQTGDAALLRVAEILRHQTRPDDLLARLGGDEFAVWMDGVDADTAKEKAQMLVNEAKKLAPFSGGPDCPLMFSVGVAVSHPEQGEKITSFLQRADEAMYIAKNSGKGRFHMAANSNQSQP